MPVVKDVKKKSTYEFVEKTGRDRYFAARDREIQTFQNPSGGIRSEFAEPVKNCTVCGFKTFKFLFEKQGFRFMRCGNVEHCGHLFADPQIREDVLMKAYRGKDSSDEAIVPSANDLWIEVLLSDANQQYDTIKFQEGINAIENALETGTEKSRRILDIGCSIGHFLAIARKRNWSTLGLEINEKAIAHARGVFGLDVRSELLEKAHLGDASFDAVTLWGVIEHLKRPVDTLKEIVRILKPGGVLLTFSPNADSLVCRVLRQNAATFDGRNHPSYFSPKSIRLAISLAGMGNISITFYQPNLDAVLNHLDWKDPYVNRNDFNSELQHTFSRQLKVQMEEFIINNGLGYKMMTINRKPLEY